MGDLLTVKVKPKGHPKVRDRIAMQPKTVMAILEEAHARGLGTGTSRRKDGKYDEVIIYHDGAMLATIYAVQGRQLAVWRSDSDQKLANSTRDAINRAMMPRKGQPPVAL